MDLNDWLAIFISLSFTGFFIWFIMRATGLNFKRPNRPSREVLYSRRGKAFLKDHPKPSRRYLVQYDLIYDGGSSEFDRYYRTYFGARIAAFYHTKIGSWGGDVVLIDRYKEIDERSQSRN
ncbi:hypothetical protein PQB77_gp60 [Arthrobacter phage Correa]|uniref:Uncharacterized protein n=2 Tax=Mudcatvirus TaxID=1982088 RepID=A0A222Z9K3_9CAUD|nr:hypothetical protein PQB75_gp065 [Arthrobacter phage Tribby]YP_010666348.1 hypothetical protein PQB77_gp60 [Arthrobacter phage Correa]ASR80121.1 hypothetical protein SEA_CORREA_60 [Arthrobacter phage Correa]ASR80516.1 hypothetical protein SEA_TRIBBY_65 [Arthrobacter phage Tribby]